MYYRFKYFSLLYTLLGLIYTNNKLIYLMLNILKKIKNIFNDKSLNTHYLVEKDIPKIKNEYNNIIYNPSSSKEWFNTTYSYNKSYIKSLVSFDVTLNNLFRSYFNMSEGNIKVSFKRRRSNKKRYSANKLYLSRAELKHTSTKIIIILYIYNKQKSSIQRYMRKLVIFTKTKKLLIQKKINDISTHKNRLVCTL